MTVVMSIVAYFWVYNYPATAEFLTDKERAFIQFRLKNDSDATRDEKFSWTAVFEAFKDVKVWLYGLCFHTMSLPLYTLSLFMVRCVDNNRLYCCLIMNVAHDHQGTGLFGCQGPAAYCPSLCLGIHSDNHRRNPF